MKEIYSKEDLKKELVKAAEKVDGKLSMKDFQKHSDVSLSPIIQADKARWDSWNEAKKEAGLEIKEKGCKKKYTDEELLDELRRVFYKTENYLTSQKFDEESEIYSSTISTRLGSWNEAKKKAGIRKEELKRVFDKWVEFCKEKGYGKITTTELEDNCPNFSYISINDFADWNKERDNGLKIRGYRPNSNLSRGTIFVKTDEDNFESKMLDKYGDKIDAEFHDVFFSMIAEGLSPTSIVGAITYLTDDDFENQKEAADYANCTTVSIRNVRDRIFEKGFLEEYQ